MILRMLLLLLLPQEYNTDVFDQSTMERMMGSYLAVLEVGQGRCSTQRQ
jgi:hypothetical protein